MGFFSWNALDTDGKSRAVMNCHTDECRPVWWYFPKHVGLEPLLEECYEGYGNFGVCSYGELLYDMNKEHIAKKYGEAVLTALDHQLNDFDYNYYEDTLTGKRWAYHNVDLLSVAVGVRAFIGNYETPQPACEGKTPNELIKSGVWKEKKLKFVKYPIRLAFFADGEYETLPKSRHAKNQGFFS